MPALVCSLLLALFFVLSSTKQVTISNLHPKLSTSGAIVNGHDGTYKFFEGYYWYHAAEYGLCKEPPKNGCDQTPGPVGPPYPAPGHCGFQADHNVSIWRSRDLTSGSWEFMGRAARCDQDIPDCKILYRPHVVFNPTTQLYVLFVNFVKTTGYGGNAVFTAPAPEGPFVLRTPQMNLTRLCPGPAIPDGQVCGEAQGGCGDFDVIVDSDDSAYIVYGCHYYMGIERLTLDYLQSAGPGENATVVGGLFDATTFPEYFTEAPAFFQRLDTFYLLFGHCCCFCSQGSGVMVYTAPSPRGPWQPQCSDVQNQTGCLSRSGDLACVSDSSNTSLPNPPHLSGSPTPGQGCNYQGRKQHSSLRAQQNVVINVKGTDGKDTFIWTGDRWQQSPDGLKGHEGQTWAVLEFDTTGRIQPIRWQDEIEFDVVTDGPELELV